MMINQLQELMSASASQEETSASWQKAWETGITPWDKLKIQPALQELLDDFGSEWGLETVKNGTALVPGCGRGYDVLFLSSKVKECCGWDISAKAVELAQEWVESQQKSGDQKVTFVNADFFSHEGPEDGFDLAYDYTFLCALPTSQRAQWAARYRELLKPGGKLITLIYPIDGDRPGGPPYSLDPEEVCELLTKTGFKRIYFKAPSKTDHPQRELVAVWEKLP